MSEGSFVTVTALRRRGRGEGARRRGSIAGALPGGTPESRLARQAAQDELDEKSTSWTRNQDKFEVQRSFIAEGVPSAAVQKPPERIDHDPGTEEFGLWPFVDHAKMGRVRVDGLPAHFSKTDWKIERGGPCVGQHTDEVLTELLGYDADELARLHEEGVV